ncbi:MAG TPA: hypothetical protein VMN57_00540 [Anaerolineales bacterium]|nr:hypothetical protein [Anaerolineales bacterium]
MKRSYDLDPMSVITLSFRQTLKRALFWARLAVWRIFFSIPIVTMPAAKAAFFQAAAEGLRDPYDQEVNPREAFVRGFFDQAVRGTAVAVINILVLSAIVFGILFWSVQENFYLNLLAGIALPFLVLWWMCQPFLYPCLVEHPELPVMRIVRETIRLATGHPGYSFVTAFVLTWLFLLSIPLVGPLSLLTVPFLALIATQAYWTTAGILIPDLVDPIRYAEIREAQRESRADEAVSGE